MPMLTLIKWETLVNLISFIESCEQFLIFFFFGAIVRWFWCNFARTCAITTFLIQCSSSSAASSLAHNDKDFCRCLASLSRSSLVPNEWIQEVVDAGVVPRLVALLDHTEISVITPTLRIIGNIVSGSDALTDSVLDAGTCPLLAKLLEHSKMNITKSIEWLFRFPGYFSAPWFPRRNSTIWH